jgi:hypothetical protein
VNTAPWVRPPNRRASAELADESQSHRLK